MQSGGSGLRRDGGVLSHATDHLGTLYLSKFVQCISPHGTSAEFPVPLADKYYL